jgi:hypothetical protein
MAGGPPPIRGTADVLALSIGYETYSFMVGVMQPGTQCWGWADRQRQSMHVCVHHELGLVHGCNHAQAAGSVRRAATEGTSPLRL